MDRKVAKPIQIPYYLVMNSFIMYFSAHSEKEKRTILRSMSREAKTFEDWLFIFAFAKEQNLHYMAEKKLVAAANTLPDLLFIIKNYRLSEEKEERAVIKALAVASEKELDKLEPLCSAKLMYRHFTKEKMIRSLERLLS